jgi:F0F1-type ATP synthase assembly protein I
MVIAHTEIPELDRQGLRRFALSTSAIVAVLFGLFFPWLLDVDIPVWPWIVAGVLSGWGLIAPTSLRPVYRGWMRFGLLLNRIVQPVILGVLFFLIITPTSALMRLLRRDAMARSLDENAESYRVPSVKRPKSHMERPF